MIKLSDVNRFSLCLLFRTGIRGEGIKEISTRVNRKERRERERAKKKRTKKVGKEKVRQLERGGGRNSAAKERRRGGGGGGKGRIKEGKEKKKETKNPPQLVKGLRSVRLSYTPPRPSFHVSVSAGIGHAITRRIKMEAA